MKKGSPFALSFVQVQPRRGVYRRSVVCGFGHLAVWQLGPHQQRPHGQTSPLTPQNLNLKPYTSKPLRQAAPDSCLTPTPNPTPNPHPQVYAFSRDGAIPGSHFWHKVASNKVPVFAVWGSLILGMCFIVPYIGSAVAYNAVSSIATVALYLAYGIPIFLRCELWGVGCELWGVGLLKASHLSTPPTPGNGVIYSPPALVCALIFPAALFCAPSRPIAP